MRKLVLAFEQSFLLGASLEGFHVFAQATPKRLRHRQARHVIIQFPVSQREEWRRCSFRRPGVSRLQGV